MNYEQFINQQVTNYKGEKGYVVSFEKERVIIQIGDKQVMYKPDVAFKNKALVFDNDRLNQLVNADIEQQEVEQITYQKKIEKIHSEAIKINNMSAKKYVELQRKEATLKGLFGADFVYPPFQILKKKFPHAKKKNPIEAIFAKWDRYYMMNDNHPIL